MHQQQGYLSTVTRLRAGRQGVRFPAGAGRQTDSGASQPPIQWVTRALSPEVKRSGREALPPPPYTFRDNFTPTACTTCSDIITHGILRSFWKFCLILKIRAPKVMLPQPVSVLQIVCSFQSISNHIFTSATLVNTLPQVYLNKAALASPAHAIETHWLQQWLLKQWP
jgi:hypothetical protein